MKCVKETLAGLLVSKAAPTATARARSGRRANQLDGKTWTKNSISIWSDINKSAEEIKLGHPALFPLQLAQRLIECFTTESDSQAQQVLCCSCDGLVAPAALIPPGELASLFSS